MIIDNDNEYENYIENPNEIQNNSEIYEDAEPQIIFKYKPNRANISDNYKIVEEPKFCVIRTNFNVDDNDFTEFEKKNLDYFTN
jgi:hypothetical protein